jgi:hypothetical protein
MNAIALALACAPAASANETVEDAHLDSLSTSEQNTLTQLIEGNSRPRMDSASNAPTSDLESLRDASQKFNDSDVLSSENLALSASGEGDAATAKISADALVSDDGTELSVESGQKDLLVSSPLGSDLPEVQIGGQSVPDSITATDDSIVQEEVAPHTDLVSRPTQNGFQTIAVLSDSKAPSSVEFSFELEDSETTLSENADGSIDVLATRDIEVPSTSDEERFNSEIDAIVGEGTTELSENQLDRFLGVSPVATEVQTVTEKVAEIQIPWAVDANGTRTKTHFEITNGELRQVIETDEHTDFPVISDPSWAWWVGTGTACAVGVVSILASAAKIARLVAKFNSLKNKYKKLATIVNKLGGIKAAIQKMYYAAKGKLEGKATKYASAAQLKEIKNILSQGLNLVLDGVGIGSCGSLIGMMI